MTLLEQLFWELKPHYGSPKLALELIQHGGVDPNSCDETGTPLLIAAAEGGSWDAFAALIQAGADPSSQTPEGYTAIHFAMGGAIIKNWRYWSQRCIGDSKKIVDYCQERVPDNHPAQAVNCIARKRLGQFRKCFDGTLSVDCRFPDPRRALLPVNSMLGIKTVVVDVALKLEQEAALSTELQVNAALRPPDPGALGPTLLMWASALGRQDFVEYLRNSGADATIRDELGMTADDYARANGHSDDVLPPAR